MVKTRVLIVVPTLGTRISYLRESLESIMSQEMNVDLVVVCPANAREARDIATRHGAQVIDDPGSLPAAINAGMAKIKTNHEYVNWLGDDDLLEPGSLIATSSVLDGNPQATVAYGACRYIDENDNQLWVSRAGKWAPRILGWGPDLIPQPGMLVRAPAWREVGGLDETLTMAFDLDLLLKLKRIGPLIDTQTIVSNFRWHTTSLTASDRSTNLDESEQVKRRYLSPTQSKLKWIWEKPVRIATRAASSEVQRRARAKNAL